MGRRITGTIEWRAGCWHARVTLPDGSRPWVAMPGIPLEDAKRARDIASVMAKRAKARGMVPSMRDETVNEYLERWTAWRSKSGLTSAGESESQVRIHFAARHGVMPMASVRREHLEDFVADLDAKVQRTDLRWKHAQNIWGSVSKMFADATNAKDRALRAIEQNPAVGVRPPDKGDATAKQYLYPDEFLTLVGSETTPLARARLYTVTVYTYSRAGELVPLVWPDVDLAHGTVHFHKSIDRCRTPDVTKGIKTKSARRIPIEDELAPLLEAMRAEAPAGDAARLVRVFPSLPRADGEYGLSGILKRDLAAAGVTRAELFTPSRTAKAMTFHDLRATGTTWMAVRGDAPLTIQQRAGHASFATTQGYIREAEVNRAGFGTVFPGLPGRLTESSTNRPIVLKKAGFFGKPVGAAGFEGASEVADRTRKAGGPSQTDGRNRPTVGRLHGAGAADLARAALLAAKAGRWDLVAALSRQVDASRAEEGDDPPTLKTLTQLDFASSRYSFAA